MLAVGAGGFVGAVLRYLIGSIPLEVKSGFPFNTFAINMLMLTAVAKLSERGIEVPLLTSANLPGGDEKNKKLEEQYAPLVKHL